MSVVGAAWVRDARKVPGTVPGTLFAQSDYAATGSGS